mgnify:FL=1
MTDARVVRGRMLSFRDDPRVQGGVVAYDDGAVVVDGEGRIEWSGAFSKMPKEFANYVIDQFSDKIIVPGFIDAHVHFPQQRMLAAPAKDLLDWLNRFAYIEEARYSDSDFAATAADRFLSTLISHGTTSALAFSSVHKGAADCLFQAADKRGMCLITGKTMMDRNAPNSVLDTVETGARDSADLIAKWHQTGRMRYAITVRFAVTSTDAQLQAAGELYRDYPDCLMHTHISESVGEIEFVKQLFPWSKDYTDVYDRFNLLGANSIFAHGIHLSERECQSLHDSGSMVVHCPTSNNFLGSGLFDIDHLRAPGRPVNVGVATDVAGGTSYSMLQTLGEAYKVAILKGRTLTAYDGFYLATLGNARGLGMESDIGSLERGAYADLVVLDPVATDILAARNELSETLEDTLFALMMLGDDRAVHAVFIKGQRQ